MYIILSNQPEWEGHLSSAAKVQWDEWRAKRKDLISEAVDLTRRIEGPDCDAKRWVKRTVREKMGELSLFRELEMLETTLTAIMEKEDVPQSQGEASRPSESDGEITEVLQAQIAPQPQAEASPPSGGGVEIPEPVLERMEPQPQAEVPSTPKSEPKTELTWLALVHSADRGPDLAARIDELVRSGVRPSAQDISEILVHHRFDVMEQIIARGIVHPAWVMVKESAEDEEPMPLLAYAIKHDLGDSFLRTVLEKGADLEVSVGSGETAQTIVGLAIKRQWDEKFIKRMIESGAPLPRRIDGVALVEFLYRRKQFKLMNVVIAHGSPTDIQIDGRTLLGKMILDYPEFVHSYILRKVLVRVGYEQCNVLSKFDLNAKGAMGQNVLHDYFESETCVDEVFLKLIELGANPDHRNADGKTPLMVLLDRGTAAGKKAHRQSLRVLERAIDKVKSVSKRRKK